MSFCRLSACGGGYTILLGLKVFGRLDFANIWNPGNIAGAPFRPAMKLTFGLTYTL